MWPVDRPPKWVDRSQELAALRAGVDALRQGGGTAVWVEGDPGIGKSSLVVEALAGAGELGWDIGWGMADQLTERLPLSVIQDCLRVRLSSPDPRRAHAAELLRSQRLGLFADGDASVSSIEVMMALADELCAAAPTVMVLDDLQWADDASLLVWHQLAASLDQLRLLLIATCRADPRRPEVQQVRTSLARRGGAVVALGPLPETDVAALVTAMLGTPSGDTLAQLTAQAAGNPLYLRELVDALARERAQRPPRKRGRPGRPRPACGARDSSNPIRSCSGRPSRTTGRQPAAELPAAAEDLTAVLAERGRRDEARAALNEAVSLYEGLDARWDIRRADSRLRPYGIRRGVRGPRGPRAASGWAALTPTEVKIAALVARGDSTSEIARGMFLSRRTVQTYISHILAKLGAKSRVEIVGEALRHGVSP